MRPAKGKRRLLWAIGLPVFLLLAGAGILWFLLIYRAKESLRYLVDKESKGVYAFDARSVTLSLRHRSILIKDAILYCRDTTQTDAWYNIRIPEAYLSINSWRQMLVQKKILVDSLSILRPVMDMHVLKNSVRKTHADFKASDILDYLQTALVHFNVHAFSLRDAAFVFHGPAGTEPLQGEGITLVVSNFAQVNNEDSHLLGSDKVFLSMGRQHWPLAGGRHVIDFRGLRFNSKGQRFELDSFAYRQPADSGRGAITLEADQFFFNSRHLPAIYQKDELLLDTVTCVNPVLSVPAYGGRSKDSAARVRNYLFKHINVRFISVVDGDLALQSKDGRQQSASTRRANLDVFNLDLNPLLDPPLHTDSVRINLHSIAFLTKDSLYKLSIGEFTMHGTGAYFHDVVYEPTLPTAMSKAVTFHAPELVLRDISLGDLLQQHLRASAAELREPVISMTDRGGSAPLLGGASRAGAAAPKGAPATSEAKMALFYKTLHNVSELIDVADFTVTHGAAHYRAEGTNPLEGNVTDLNAHILLNLFFISDSLVDIKRAIPGWHIGELSFSSPTLQLGVRHYRFDGQRSVSVGESVSLQTAKGLRLQATNVYWNVLDWDVYQKTKAIQLDSIHADRLTISDSALALGRSSAGPGRDSAGAAAADNVAAAPAPKDLPVLRVRRLDVDRIDLRGAAGSNGIAGTVEGLEVDGLRSEGRFLAWDRVGARFSGVALGAGLTIGSGALTPNGDAEISDLDYRSEKLMLRVPRVRLSMDAHSSDMSRLRLNTLQFQAAAVRFSSQTPKDTIAASATLSARLKNIVLPSGHSGITTDVEAHWQDGRLTYRSKGISVQASKLEGRVTRDTLHLAKGMTFRWQEWPGLVTLNSGAARLTTATLNVSAARLAWNPENKSLTVNNFYVLPRLDLEQSFAKATWQTDFITIRGRAVTVSGVGLGGAQGNGGGTGNGGAGDSAITAQRILLDGVSLEAYRDKNMPFHHGIEKPMPTQLTGRIRFPVRVDSVLLAHDTVTYHERSVATGRWSVIPLDDINGAVTNLYSRAGVDDTLRIEAGASLFGGRIHRFSYQESYGDSLSGFMASCAASPLDLTRFSAISVPAAAVRITSGQADTVFASWSGNKYAIYGTMGFFYDGLGVRLLDKRTLSHRGFLLRLETVALNVLLPQSRKKPVDIYFERDREKFVFNYWIKAQTSGLMATIGLKKGRKYRNRVKTAAGYGKRT
ncbi:MAG TPA: hypothetical protein VL547_22690 [Dinghuibacter sp.]|uniref:hypothetical protein n=1 Tax=Dinghuibacter sp. TaxID=2024697 RepID=UPI002B84D583|nr:hypothetical protein [Dinghuibacter sp.]HTJ14870.1 hypothetical protein [Dinghuibacter sp.]